MDAYPEQLAYTENDLCWMTDLMRAAIGKNMLQLGVHIRLTSRDVERLRYITGFEPVGIRRLADLDAYVEQCKQHLQGRADETRLLHKLIDETVASCSTSACSILHR
ncbi:hypothetical protein [Janthinobacterium tructae]|jgi:hypothetical protein|nr:hypothetical protein [Janthinobacterium tructae]